MRSVLKFARSFIGVVVVASFAACFIIGGAWVIGGCAHVVVNAFEDGWRSFV